MTDAAVGVAIVGGGPAGLTAAAALAAGSTARSWSWSAKRETGGIPRHSDHPGYGMRDLHALHLAARPTPAA